MMEKLWGRIILVLPKFKFFRHAVRKLIYLRSRCNMHWSTRVVELHNISLVRLNKTDLGHTALLVNERQQSGWFNQTWRKRYGNF